MQQTVFFSLLYIRFDFVENFIQKDIYKRSSNF